jgi:hypothetical protein
MHKWLMTLGLICLGFCSCQRVVWTAKPIIENGDKSDLSLAGVWTRYHRPDVDVVAADETIEVTGPDGTGTYHATTKGATPDRDLCVAFVASRLPDGSGGILLQVDLSHLAGQPFNSYAYAAVKDEWLFLRRIDSQKVTDVIKRENMLAVIVHSGFSTEVSADPDSLLRLLECRVKQITADAGVYRRTEPLEP